MKSRRLLAAILATTALIAGMRCSAADPKPIEAYTAFAASLGTGRAGLVNITLYRWSADEEREMLLSTLQEFGRDKLVDALQKIRPRVGFVRTANSMGWDLYYARDHRNPDGTRRVVLATDRPVTFGEVSRNTRSMDYRVTIIEIHLDANGKGEGKLVPAAKITWDKDAKKLEIENYNALPVDLLQVKVKETK
jgi:hypothetical protein